MQTKFADDSSDTSTYHYDNTDDPCQVSAIDHTHRSWPQCITLHYDLRGRLISDSLGRSLTWDGQDHVTRVEYQGQTCAYAYDPSGNLCDRTLDGRLARSFHSGDQMTHEQCGDDTLLVMEDADIPYAISRLAKGVHQGTTLLGCDAQRSVRVEVSDEVSSRHYTAHGAESLAQFSPVNPFGFAGERREPLTGWYIPGGYRPYDPLLMIFLAPDSESPFGEGGLNTYAYCGGDPVNRIDPSGHFAWAVAELVTGLVLGTIALAVSLTTTLPLLPVLVTSIGALSPSALLSIASTLLAGVSLGTGAASGIMKLTNPDSRDAKILGHVSFVTGALASAAGTAEKIMTKLGPTSVFNKPIRSLWRSTSRASSPGPRPPSASSLPSEASRSSPSLPRSERSSSLSSTRSSIRPGHDEIPAQGNVISDSQRPMTDIGPQAPTPARGPSGAVEVPAGPRTETVHQTARLPLESTIPPPPGPVNRIRLIGGRLRGPRLLRRLYDYHETAL